MKKLILASLALCIASPALAMGVKPNTEPTPAPTREAVAEYDTLAQLLNQATLAMQPNKATKAQADAAKPAFDKLFAAVSAARTATEASPFNRTAFDKQAAAARTYHAQACSVLPGC